MKIQTQLAQLYREMGRAEDAQEIDEEFRRLLV